MLVLAITAFAALLSSSNAFAVTHDNLASEIGYLRVSVKPCGSIVQLMLLQRGLPEKTWHYPAKDHERHYCLPLYLNTNHRIIGSATLVVTANDKTRKVAVMPNQFGEDYPQLYPDVDMCQAGDYNDAEVTCGNFTTAQEDFQVLNRLTRGSIQWQNGYDRTLEHSCSDRQAFYRVQSEHSNGAEDRHWKWTCRTTTDRNYDHCTSWSGYQNDWDKPLFYQCPANYILTGVSSYHSNSREDRRWRFICCHAPYYYTRDCSSSSYVNGWDDDMDYRTSASDRVFVGVFSYHSNSAEDRRWRIMSCKYLRCDGL